MAIRLDIGIDFDGTIAEVTKDHSLGKPIEEARDALKALKEWRHEGRDGKEYEFRLVLDSCRTSTRCHGTDHIKRHIAELTEWFKDNDIPMDKIEVNEKRSFVFRIDDRGIQIFPKKKTTWADAMEDIYKDVDNFIDAMNNKVK